MGPPLPLGRGEAVGVALARGDAVGRGEVEEEAGAVPLAPPLLVAGAPVSDGAAVLEGPSLVAVGMPLSEGGAEMDVPSEAVAVPERLPIGGEEEAEGLPLDKPVAESDAAGEGERSLLPVASRPAPGEAVAARERLPTAAEGVACNDGLALPLWVAVTRRELLPQVEGEGSAEAVRVAGAGDAEGLDEGDPEPVPRLERLTGGEREGVDSDEDEAGALGEREGAAPEGDGPGDAVEPADFAPV